MKFSIRDVMWLTLVCALTTSLVVQSYRQARREAHLRAALEATKGFRSMVEQKSWIEVVSSTDGKTPVPVTIMVEKR